MFNFQYYWLFSSKSVVCVCTALCCSIARDGKLPINNEDDSIKFEKLINISVECLMPFVRSRSITDCYTFGIRGAFKKKNCIG